MAWEWDQSGSLTDANGNFVASGYSGFGAGKNNPALQNEANIGPIPQGLYTIGPLEDLHGGEHGPCILRLTPDATNEMFGRSGFLIHGDSLTHAGSASHGCIILDRETRLKIAASNDHVLRVR